VFGGQTFSNLRPREEARGPSSYNEGHRTKSSSEKNPSLERRQGSDGKRKKMLKKSLDLSTGVIERRTDNSDDKQYTETSDPRPESNEVPESSSLPLDETVNSPSKRRKKIARVPVAQRVSNARNTRAGKGVD